MWYVKFFFFKQKTAYEMCGRDWSSDVCSSDLSRRAMGTSAVLGLMVMALTPGDWDGPAGVAIVADRKSVV